MEQERLRKQLSFLIEIDKMKTVLRRTLLCDKSRQETDAEHSWHLATMAMLLYEYADTANVDLNRVIRMALVHDLVEVYAGDTFAYDKAGNVDKEKREKEAADKLFGMLPSDQGEEICALWEEFDAMETSDALFAASLDRLQPLLNNYMTEGHTWHIGVVTSKDVYARAAVVEKACPALWPVVTFIISDSIKKGWLTP